MRCGGDGGAGAGGGVGGVGSCASAGGGSASGDGAVLSLAVQHVPAACAGASVSEVQQLITSLSPAGNR